MVEFGEKHKQPKSEDPPPSGAEIVVVVLGPHADLPDGDSFLAAVPDYLRNLMQPGEVVIHVDGSGGEFQIAGIEQVPDGPPDEGLLEELRRFCREQPAGPKPAQNKHRPSPDGKKSRRRRRGK